MAGKMRQRLARVRRRTWLILGVVAVLVIAAGTTGVVWATTRQSAQAAPITQTVAASLETLQKTVEASGTLTPTVQEQVSFAASGTVQSVEVEAGDTVEQGQTLATIDSLQADAALLQARANLAEAEAQLASARAEADGSTASNASIAARESAVDVAAQSVSDAEKAAAGVVLKAPVAGLVTSVGVSAGDAVTGDSGSASVSGGGSASSAAPGSSGSSSASSSSASGASAQFTIVGTDSWSVSVTLGETELSLIEVDDQVELETADGARLFGVVSEIGRLPSTTSGTAAFPVVIDVTGETEGLFDGTSVTATIIYERRSEVLTVPSAAVTTADDGTATVTLVDADGSETEQEVTVGEISGDLTEITAGLEEGDQVLVVVFTPGEGNSSVQSGQGGMPGSGGMPDFGSGEMPDFGGQMPGGGQMPSFGGGDGGGQGGFPGGAAQ